MARFSTLIMLLSACIMSAHAQFGFFDQMFNQGGQQQQQQQQQNVRSDASWYQAQYEAGKSAHIKPSTPHLLTIPQHTAHTTSAPAPSPVSASHTTVPARGKAPKIKSSWARGLRFVGVKEVGWRASLGGRWSWLGRGCCELCGGNWIWGSAGVTWHEGLLRDTGEACRVSVWTVTYRCEARRGTSIERSAWYL
jgi:hypothetical protein